MDIVHVLRRHTNDCQTSSVNLDPFVSLLDGVEQQLTADLVCQNNQHIARCIDLEGLDGCGKSTLVQALHRQLTERGQKSRSLSTPPASLLPFRAHFDEQPASVRRAYYNFGNLLVSFELKNETEAIVVLDRYWPSTIAYHLARSNEPEPADLSWPNYLVQPALIVYVYVDETERCRRIAQRSIPVTLEEKELAAQEEFRRRLDTIYRTRIPSRHVHAVDGNRPVDVITDEILRLFQE